MVRPKILRKIDFEPDVDYFKPAGVPVNRLEISNLNMEEAEALRLSDSKGMNQGEAAKQMGISQPTFHRLLVSARKTVAGAITNGRAIKIKGGSYRQAGQRFVIPEGFCVCPKCRYRIKKSKEIPCYTRGCPRCETPMTRE